MVRVKRETANEDGWTDWIHPLPGYRMFCCDCGMAHNFELSVHDGKPYFRVSRNDRATAQMRRHNKHAMVKAAPLKPVSKKATVSQAQADAAVRKYRRPTP